MEWMPRIDRDICTGCRRCVTVCPTHALEQVDGKAALTAPAACIYCSVCETICPVNAIELPFLIVFDPVQRKRDEKNA